MQSIPVGVTMFWFFWVLNVQCGIDEDGDFGCLLTARDGHQLECTNKASVSESTEKLSIKPEMDFTCLYPVKKW